MTKREFLNDVLANYVDLSDEGREVATKMIAALDKKYAKSDKPSKRQIENEEIKVRIMEFLDAQGSATATEIGNAVDVSCQRASALLKQMGIAKAKVKGKMLYGAVSADAETEGEDE